MNCPHCGREIVKPLAHRAGLATQHVLKIIADMPRGHTLRASEVTVPGFTAKQINNAFCYLQSRGLIERVSYGHYRKQN